MFLCRWNQVQRTRVRRGCVRNYFLSITRVLNLILPALLDLLATRRRAIESHIVVPQCYRRHHSSRVSLPFIHPLIGVVAHIC